MKRPAKSPAGSSKPTQRHQTRKDKEPRVTRDAGGPTVVDLRGVVVGGHPFTVRHLRDNLLRADVTLEFSGGAVAIPVKPIMVAKKSGGVLRVEGAVLRENDGELYSVNALIKR